MKAMAILLTAALALGVARPTVARAGCDPATAAARDAALRAQLAHAERANRRWNWTWAGVFAGLSGLQLLSVARESSPGRPYDDAVEAGLLLGAAKAGLASLTRVVTPLRAVRPPAATGDPCRDLEAARTALAATARRQRTTFWMSHAGGLALTIGGALLLGLAFDSWTEGVISVVTGYPVGLLHAYTMPRGAWKAHRRTLGVTVQRRDDYAGVALVGAF